jgi:hypothetical protein
MVFAAGAVSAVAFTYFAWRISPGNKIALDSHKDPGEYALISYIK